VNEAAEIIHSVAHPDANIIFGAVIDDNMGDEVRVTVIAAGFERWEEGGRPATGASGEAASHVLGLEPPAPVDIFADADEDALDLGDDDFDVPSFLR
jgi:cell division protein FtsZ